MPIFELKDGRIILHKEPNELDKFVLRFVEILKELKIKYVIVSGYPAILFGRSRVTEDVDFIIEKFGAEKMKELIESCDDKGFWLINSDSPTELLSLLEEANMRVAREKGQGVPNIELKFPKDEFDFHALENPIIVSLSGTDIKLSPVELQIAYKLYLGSGKDIEDAKHLYIVCREILDSKKLLGFLNKLNIGEELRKHLRA